MKQLTCKINYSRTNRDTCIHIMCSLQNEHALQCIITYLNYLQAICYKLHSIIKN